MKKLLLLMMLSWASVSDAAEEWNIFDEYKKGPESFNAYLQSLENHPDREAILSVKGPEGNIFQVLIMKYRDTADGRIKLALKKLVALLGLYPQTLEDLLNARDFAERTPLDLARPYRDIYEIFQEGLDPEKWMTPEEKRMESIKDLEARRERKGTWLREKDYHRGAYDRAKAKQLKYDKEDYLKEKEEAKKKAAAAEEEKKKKEEANTGSILNPFNWFK